MRSNWMKFVVLGVSFAMLANFADAQGGRGQGQGRGGGQFGGGMQGMGGFGAGPSNLAARPDVQTELKLTADQKSKVQAISDKMREERRAAFQGAGGGGGGQDMQARMAEMQKMSAKYDAEVLAVLTPEQTARIKQLAVQMAGANYPMGEEGQKALGVTSDQQSKLRALQDKQREAMTALFERMRNQELDFQSMGAEREKMDKIMAEEVGKILTAEQKAKWEELKGKPFAFQQQRRGGGGN
jgi:Spy/CpxP family protein refolding chaperone